MHPAIDDPQIDQVATASDGSRPSRLRLIVFSGPPCSGKSAIAPRLAKSVKAEYLDMDTIRLQLLPRSDHTKADRNVAYRTMHELAARHLATGRSVVLDATYAPEEHRKGAVALAQRSGADLFLIECRVDPDEAVKRFRHRRPGHAGVDLTTTRVRELAGTFPYSGSGLLLETSYRSEADLLKDCKRYIATKPPIALTKGWTGEWQTFHQGSATPTPPQQATDKYSAWSITFAYVESLFYVGLLVGFILFSAVMSFLIFTKKINDSQATVYLTLGLVFATSGVWGVFGRPRFQQARAAIRSARELVFGPVVAVGRSDRDLFHAYLRRVPVDQRHRFPIANRPVFFLVAPQPGVRFCVDPDLSGGQFSSEELAERARHRGFDWRMYADWRRRQKASEYYGPTRHWERVVRLCGVDPRGPVPSAGPLGGSSLKVAFGLTTYRDYLVAEQGLDFEVPGQIPYLREFMEGPGWLGGSVDLMDVRLAARSFPLMVSISVIVETSDGSLVLQRKSNRIQSPGSMAASAAGAVRWPDAYPSSIRLMWMRLNGAQRFDLVTEAVLRELKEEIGLQREHIQPEDLRHPFIAVAFGLRYGRDVNFYAHLRTTLNSKDVGQNFVNGRRSVGWPTRAARDRWEVAHLAFVPNSQVEATGTPDRDLEEMLGNSRHVRGALYAYRIAGSTGADAALMTAT